MYSTESLKLLGSDSLTYTSLTVPTLTPAAPTCIGSGFVCVCFPSPCTWHHIRGTAVPRIWCQVQGLGKHTHTKPDPMHVGAAGVRVGTVREV